MSELYKLTLEKNYNLDVTVQEQSAQINELTDQCAQLKEK